MISNNLTQKTQLAITINFISSKDENYKERELHLNNDNIEIIISNEAKEVIKKLFDSPKDRYQNNLQSMKGRDFVFYYAQLLYCRCHKINLNRGGSYIDSPDWIKTKAQQ